MFRASLVNSCAFKHNIMITTIVSCHLISMWALCSDYEFHATANNVLRPSLPAFWVSMISQALEAENRFVKCTGIDSYIASTAIHTKAVPRSLIQPIKTSTNIPAISRMSRRTPETPYRPILTLPLTHIRQSQDHPHPHPLKQDMQEQRRDLYFLTVLLAFPTTLTNSPYASPNSSASSSLPSFFAFALLSLLIMTTLVGLLVALASPSCARLLM